jgi:hypothetical protein
MANVVIDIAAQFTGKNAFNKATSATNGLEKSVGRLAKQFVSLFAAQKIYSFGKASVKAFAEDEKAARSLALAVANTGNAFAQMDVESFIQRIQRATGVLDDNLRPAFRTLITATGDVKKSQDGLALALDISAGTGKDLGAVSMALAKAYGGQTTALSRLGAGLSKATLATGDMDLITQELQARFSGQALEATKGFAGQMNLLTVAVNDAKEAIGKGLVDALGVLAGNQSGVGGAVGVINSMATGIAEGAKNIAFMIKQFEALKPVIIAIGALLLIYFAPVTAAVAALTFLLAKGGQNLKKSQFNQGKIPGGMGNVSMSVSSQDTQRAQTAARLKADKERLGITKTGNTLKKIENDLTARKLALTGDEKALLELEKKYDVTRIGLFSALNQATDSETKMRLLSLIAIHDQNAALAGQIKKAEESKDALAAFTDAIRAAIRALLDMVAAAQAKLMSSLDMSAATSIFNTNDPNAVSGGMPGAVLSDGFNAGTFRAAESASMNVTVNVGGSISTERDIVNAITQGIYNNQASGIPISYTTAYR